MSTSGRGHVNWPTESILISFQGASLNFQTRKKNTCTQQPPSQLGSVCKLSPVCQRHYCEGWKTATKGDHFPACGACKDSYFSTQSQYHMCCEASEPRLHQADVFLNSVVPVETSQSPSSCLIPGGQWASFLEAHPEPAPLANCPVLNTFLLKNCQSSFATHICLLPNVPFLNLSLNPEGKETANSLDLMCIHLTIESRLTISAKRYRLRRVRRISCNYHFFSMATLL